MLYTNIKQFTILKALGLIDQQNYLKNNKKLLFQTNLVWV